MCMGDTWTADEIRAEFEAKMAAVIETGEFYYVFPTSLDTDTLAAIDRVAQNPTDDAIALAHRELELQLDGTHIQCLKALMEIGYQ